MLSSVARGRSYLLCEMCNAVLVVQIVAVTRLEVCNQSIYTPPDRQHIVSLR